MHLTRTWDGQRAGGRCSDGAGARVLYFSAVVPSGSFIPVDGYCRFVGTCVRDGQYRISKYVTVPVSRREDLKMHDAPSFIPVSLRRDVGAGWTVSPFGDRCARWTPFTDSK